MIAKISYFLTLTLIVALATAGCSQWDEAAPIREERYDGVIRVACVGDSITFGSGIKNRDQNSYPAQLGAMLGEKYEVRNFGVGGATLLKNGELIPQGESIRRRRAGCAGRSPRERGALPGSAFARGGCPGDPEGRSRATCSTPRAGGPTG